MKAADTTATSATQPSPHRRVAERFIDGFCHVTEVAVSPSGAAAAFVVARVDLAANTTRSQIWLADLVGGGAARPITGGERDRSPAWSPDGMRLAFVAKRGAKDTDATLHVMPIGGPGELRTLCTMADGIAEPAWSPDGAHIAFTSRTRHERYEAADESWQAPRKIERFFARLDDEGWVADRPSHVYVVGTDGLGAPSNLTPGEFQHRGIAWLADSSGVITSAGRHDRWDLDFATDLYRIGLDGTAAALTAQTGVFGRPAVSPDGTRVAFAGHDDAQTYPQNVRIGVLDLASGDRRWVSTALDRTFEPTAGAPPPAWLDDRRLVASAEDRGVTHVYELAADGSTPPRPLTDGAATVRAFAVGGERLAVVVASVDRPAELHVDGRRLSHVTDGYVRIAEPRGWERFTVPCTDGTGEIDAWIMRPQGFDASRSYPVLLNVHGGPHTQYGETFFDEAQMQAAAGFVVLMSNPRGSSGREESWGQAIMGPKHPTRPGRGWGTVDVEDVLAVIDTALERYPFCDRTRVGMLGGSYGGYMASLLAAKHEGRFRAICSERAVNNLLSEEWSSDIGSLFRVEHGPRHIDDPDEYMRMSPIRWVRDIDVPMLLIHSENDLRCPINQAEELFMALRLLERDVTFYRFPGEGHELSRSGSPLHRVQRGEIILDFFARQLR
jgi:dipeptidyl aminopeptidase/acylaminoacyl peptidase